MPKLISPLGEHRWAMVMRWQAQQLRHSRRKTMATPTDFSALSSDGKRRYMQFNPEISMGNVLTIVALVGSGITAFYSLKEVQSNQQIQIESLKAKDLEMTNRGNERYADLKGDIKELKSAVAEMSVSIAVVRGATSAANQPLPRYPNNTGR